MSAPSAGRVQGRVDADTGARVEDSGVRTRVDAEGRARADDGTARADLGVDGRARLDPDANTIVRDRVRNWANDGRWFFDSFGRRGRYFWDGDRWLMAYGPRHGYWDGLGWGYGPWGPRYGFYDGGYYGGGYAYRQPAYAQPTSRTALGIFMQERGNNVFISSVVPGSPAEQADLRAGDMILAINGREITSADQVSALIARHVPGDELEIEVESNGQEIRAAAVLEERQRVF